MYVCIPPHMCIHLYIEAVCEADKNTEDGFQDPVGNCTILVVIAVNVLAWSFKKDREL